MFDLNGRAVVVAADGQGVLHLILVAVGEHDHVVGGQEVLVLLHGVHHARDPVELGKLEPLGIRLGEPGGQDGLELAHVVVHGRRPVDKEHESNHPVGRRGRVFKEQVHAIVPGVVEADNGRNPAALLELGRQRRCIVSVSGMVK